MICSRNWFVHKYEYAGSDVKMDIFLSAESAAPAAYLLSQMNRIISEEFNSLRSKSYV